MKARRKIQFIFAVFFLAVAAGFLFSGQNACAKSIRLNSKTVYLAPKMKYKLKVKGTKKKVRWRSSNKKIVTIGKKGKITAKKPGKATIIAKVKGKKLKCRVIVEKRKKYNVRKLRDYIVKKGRKYGSNYVIENVDVDEEQTEYIAEISARKNTTEMIFKYTIRPDVTAGSSYLYEFHIDLANKSSGRFNWYAEDMADNSGFYTWGTITTAFNGKGAGIKVRAYYDVDSAGGETLVPKPAGYSSDVGKSFAEAFKALDRLLKVKKTGVTMNSIGFTKWK